jgi:hypothetical protein
VTGPAAITAVQGARITAGECDAACGWWAAFSADALLTERTAWSASEVRRQARAHTRETGHPTVVTGTDETLYHLTGGTDD